MRIKKILLNIWMLFLSWIIVSVSVDTYLQAIQQDTLEEYHHKRGRT